jgi:hypothetical protein
VYFKQTYLVTNKGDSVTASKPRYHVSADARQIYQCVEVAPGEWRCPEHPELLWPHRPDFATEQDALKCQVARLAGFFQDEWLRTEARNDKQNRLGIALLICLTVGVIVACLAH